MGRDISYFIVYAKGGFPSLCNEDEPVIRLSFRSNTAYDLELGNPLWKPSKVQFDLINQWLGKQDNESEPTTWHYLIHQWNCENVGLMDFHEFMSGAEDEFYKELYGERYLSASTPMPDYNSDIQIEK